MADYKSKTPEFDKKDGDEPPAKKDKDADKMVVVEPVYGEMYDLDTNTRIPQNGGNGTRVKDSGFLQAQIAAGKLTLVES